MKKIIKKYKGDFNDIHEAEVSIKRDTAKTTVTITEKTPYQLWLMNADIEFAQLIKNLCEDELHFEALDSLDIIYQPRGVPPKTNSSGDDILIELTKGSPPAQPIHLEYRKAKLGEKELLAGEIEVIPLV